MKGESRRKRERESEGMEGRKGERETHIVMYPSKLWLVTLVILSATVKQVSLYKLLHVFGTAAILCQAQLYVGVHTNGTTRLQCIVVPC